MSKISILIANYNNGHFFRDAYHSLIHQTEQEWNAIILDDGSTDNSVEIIQNLIKGDSRFELHFNAENKGVAYTKNKLIALSNSDICGFLDPDDKLSVNAIEEMLKVHQKNPDTALVYSNLIICNEHLEEIEIKEKQQINNNNPYFFNLGNNIHHFNTFKKSFYKKTSGIDIHLEQAEDQDLYLKLYEVGSILHTPTPLYHYRLHEGGISNFANEYKADYWHWNVIMKTAERRGINAEEAFTKHFVRMDKCMDKYMEYEKHIHNLKLIIEELKHKISHATGELKNSRWVKLGRKIGLMKWVEKL